MFKQLGMFAILAVCLFGMVLVLVGCSETVQQMVPPPVAEPVTEPPVTEPPVTVETETDAPEGAETGTVETGTVETGESGTSPPPPDPNEEMAREPDDL